MSEKLRKQELLQRHSDEAQDIIGQAPGALISWGITIFSGVLICLIIISWMVKYSDTVKGTFTLSAENAPKSVLCKTSGKLVKLSVNEGQFVRKGTLLGYLESTADHEEVLLLSGEINAIWENIIQEKWSNVLIAPEKYRKLGELQGAFQAFYSTYTQINSLIKRGLYNDRISIIEEEIIQNAKLKELLYKQKEMLERDYSLAEQTFQAMANLSKENVIAPMEYKMEESRLIGKKMPLENLEVSLVNNASVNLSKKKETLELENQMQETKYAFAQSLGKLYSDIENWKKQYLLLAPIDGMLVFNGIVQENQELTAGEDVFYINPETETYYGQVLVDQNNLGKVDTTQLVILRLASFPFQEYGKLKGVVSRISTIPNKEGQFIVKVSLPNGLVTDTGQLLRFRSGLIADAEIITQKRRLIYKFLFTLKEIMKW